MQRKKIKIQNLMLDLENYRVGYQDGQPQAIRAIIEEQGEKLKVLARDIIANGLSPIELFMVMPFQNAKKQYVVIEGNRRITAIKLVLNPDLAKDTVLENPFKQMSADHANSVPKEIECCVVPNKKNGLPWIQRRHDRGLKGAGIEDWSSIARDRADADLGKPTPAKNVREFVLANAPLSDDLRKKITGSKFNNTNLTRLLGTAHVRKTLGLENDNHTLVSNTKPEWLLKILTDMVVGIASEEFDGKPFSESTIDKKNQRIEFIEKLAQKYPQPTKQVSPWAINANQKVHQSKSAQSPSSAKDIRTTPSSDIRKTLIPKTCKIKLPDGKCNDIYHELRRLHIDSVPNAVAVLFRVFLEFSVDAYIKVRSISLPTDKNGKVKNFLCNKLESVKNFMIQNRIMTAKELKCVQMAISNRDSLFSTETLNAYVHNSSINPKANELKLTWNDFQNFIEKLWHP